MAGQMQRMSYGADELQTALYWPGASVEAPLIVFVHGGGWSRGDMRSTIGSSMLASWQSQGFAVASLNYRLVPASSVEQQASDIAAALAYLSDNAPVLGFDRERIVLAGHSAGAHLVSLVGTDPTYLENAGLALTSIRGILALDGAAYDVPRQMEEGGRLMSQTYRNAFGTERRRQENLSPTFHAAAPNAAEFLILHIDRPDAQMQSEALGYALVNAGTHAEVHRVPGRGLRGHREINRRLGDQDYPATPLVDAWLSRVLR
ncbi:esterase [Aurantiacibacter marinus]|uniref:Esterase n=1 Tax=Aurantiacibacter marinus TaxID=874156 RepID=A0A0H0XN54_9SPHN|nr:esterase [Aurantiacibacter marinus]